ncbi:hypothetical protein ACROYT_G021699 [Oculina patagonica]
MKMKSFQKEDFAKKIVDAVDDDDKIVAIQFVPGFFVRVTFESVRARDNVYSAGLRIGGVEVRLIEAEPSVRFVYLHHCPVEVSDAVVSECFSAYGEVLDIRSCVYGTSDILTGSRILKMCLRDEIPSKLRVLRYPCRVWYRDQPLDCHICGKSGHRAANCPIRDKCRKCLQPGHFARDCTRRANDAPSDEMDTSVPLDPLPDERVRASKRQRPESDSAADLESGELSESAVDSVESAEPVPTSTLDLGTGAPADDSVSTKPPPPMPSFVSEDSIDDFHRAHRPNAVVLRESDGSFSFIDLGRLTRRCVLDDTASPEMYRECFYLDPVMKDCHPAMSEFPPGRDPLPETRLLDPSVPPASFPAVPVESSASPAVESTASPVAEASASPAAESIASPAPESSACLAVDPVPIHAADINAPLETLKVIFGNYEVYREQDYRCYVNRPPAGAPFPGPAASVGTPLSPDVVPQKFPGRPQKPRSASGGKPPKPRSASSGQPPKPRPASRR